MHNIMQYWCSGSISVALIMQGVAQSGVYQGLIKLSIDALCGRSCVRSTGLNRYPKGLVQDFYPVSTQADKEITRKITY